MKKVLMLFLSAFMVICMVGCEAETIKEEVKEDDEEDGIKLNVENDINTENGEYKFTITGAEKTDWWKRNKGDEEKEVILLTYDCENISFCDNRYNGLFFSSNAFDVVDQDDEILNECTFEYNNNYPKVLSIGNKGQYGLPYEANPGTKSIKVKFKRGGEIKIPVSET